MGYEDVDDITRQAACENVKKIVNAIKLIRIKYYPNFASISEEDQRVFKELNFDLERIASEHDLHSLKNVLMSEVSAKYENNGEKEDGSPKTNDSILLACYGAIDVQQRALSEGKIQQAIKCQRILEQYMGEIESENYKKLIIDYKREKFGELIRSKDVQSEVKNWTDLLKGCCKPDNVEDRSAMADMITNIATKSLDEKTQNQETVQNEELVIG